MPLINCPYCGHKVSDLATACPRCGRQLQPQYGPQQNQYQQRYYQQEPGLKSKNNNNTVIIVLSILVAALAIGAGILFGMMGCERNSSNGGSTTPPSSPVDSTTKGETKPPVDYDTTYVKIKQVEKIQVPNPPPPEPQEYIPDELNGYYITSGGGYGAYLRRSPSTQSTKLTVYRDGTYFEGAYSSVPRWIMVIKNGHIVGYIHDENVTPSEYYVNDGC